MLGQKYGRFTHSNTTRHPTLKHVVRHGVCCVLWVKGSRLAHASETPVAYIYIARIVVPSQITVARYVSTPPGSGSSRQPYTLTRSRHYLRPQQAAKCLTADLACVVCLLRCTCVRAIFLLVNFVAVECCWPTNSRPARPQPPFCGWPARSK